MGSGQSHFSSSLYYSGTTEYPWRATQAFTGYTGDDVTCLSEWLDVLHYLSVLGVIIPCAYRPVQPFGDVLHAAGEALLAGCRFQG